MKQLIEKFFLTSVLVLSFILVQSCLKRNIYSGVGAGGGIAAGGEVIASGITKLRVSPGNLDENISGVIDLYSVYRFAGEEGILSMRVKDFLPVISWGLFFNFIDIDEVVTPYSGITLNLVFFKGQRSLSISSEFHLVFGAEQFISKNLSLFYEIPINIMRGQALSPVYSFIFGVSFYFKRKD